MGIRLDWEIEAEKERVENAGEDPETRRRRWRARVRLFGVLLLSFGIVALLVAGVILRLRQVDWEIEQSLRDTVDAEVATLRLGDLNAFLGFQRSATDEWSIRQEAAFDDYQALKVDSDVQLTGRVLDVVIDHQRGRVQVEEVIAGASYVRTWFYWNYEDGWRHVPPDYTFWGEERVLTNESITVNYRALDERFAQVVLEDFTVWVVGGCDLLACVQNPQLTVEITPNPLAALEWIDDWQIRIPSPYMGRARLDQPFDASARFQSAVLIARRLVEGATRVQLDGEADYLREAIIRWLVERFAQVQMNSNLIYSLAARYGDAAVGHLLTQLNPGATVNIISAVTGTTMEQAGLDWRDYIAWRLADEYSGQEFEVTGALVEYSAENIPQIRAAITVGGSETEVLFRLVDAVWQRAN